MNKSRKKTLQKVSSHCCAAILKHNTGFVQMVCLSKETYLAELASCGVRGRVETVQDFLIKLEIKPLMHL